VSVKQVTWSYRISESRRGRYSCDCAKNVSHGRYSNRVPWENRNESVSVYVYNQ